MGRGGESVDGGSRWEGWGGVRGVVGMFGVEGGQRGQRRLKEGPVRGVDNTSALEDPIGWGVDERDLPLCVECPPIAPQYVR